MQFTCNLFNSLKRGKNLKIISFSLYGNKSFYSRRLANLSKTIKSMYPGWIMRVYHDDTIDPKIKCEIECLKDETNNLIDNTDFCNINKLPIKGSFNKTWQANYMHKMKWRWFPIGDDFVNVFLSRDSDSPIIQREIDAVDAWLKTDMAAHIMRGK